MPPSATNSSLICDPSPRPPGQGVRARPASRRTEKTAMNRFDFPATADEAPATVQGVLAGLQKTLGFVPNLHRLMSVSPHVLAGWFGLMSNLGKTLDVKRRESITLAASQATGCD